MSDPKNIQETIPFLVSDDPDDTSKTMSIFRSGEREVTPRGVPVGALTQNLRNSVEQLRSVFAAVKGDMGSGMNLKQVQLQFEVTAKGGVNFVGTTEVGSKGAITLVFEL